ncbi:hypothetical protein FQN57_000374 [Myotisia sp. PD_48]|nr:hypothetical protein FQN57_000374 [Myotisia sp. PD_48]
MTTVIFNSRASLAPVRLVGASQFSRACFSTTPYQQKGPIEVTKETLKKADKIVSGAAVKGIETGEKATHKIQDALGSAAKKTERDAEAAAREAKRKTEDLVDEAKEKADDFPGKA